MSTTGNGDLLTVASASTAGLLVINLATRQTWYIDREGKDLGLWVQNTGTRLVWKWFSPYRHNDTTGEVEWLDGRAGLLTFTPSSGSLELLRGIHGVSAVGAAGNATAWFVPDDPTDELTGTYFSSVGGIS